MTLTVADTINSTTLIVIELPLQTTTAIVIAISTPAVIKINTRIFFFFCF
ncbi:hypothetical protein Hanom_Chr12g01089231 [Helianthus anomalus]